MHTRNARTETAAAVARGVCAALAAASGLLVLGGCGAPGAGHAQFPGAGGAAEHAPGAKRERPRTAPSRPRGATYTYTVAGRSYRVRPRAIGYRQRGKASWYGKQFDGRPTANSETFDMYKPSAAHKTLPLPSYVRVVNLRNRRSIVVRVNDRGPFVEDRIIDLSYAAARKLGMIEDGVVPVEIELVRPPRQPRRWIQVGAYSDRGNADAVAKKLKDLRPSVFRARARGRRVNQVRLGPFAARELAAIIRQLRSRGFADYRVLP